MIDASVIKALLDRDVYLSVESHLPHNYFKEVVYSKIYTVIKAYYNKYTEGTLSCEALTKIIEIKSDALPESIKESYTTAAKNISDAVVDGSSKMLIDEIISSNLENQILDYVGVDNNKVIEAVHQYETIQQGETDTPMFTEDSLKELVESADVGSCTWSMKGIEGYVKGVRPTVGTLVIARTNAGKTSFITDNTVHFMNRGLKVLHFALSEDGDVDLMVRYYQKAFNVSEDLLLANLEHYSKLWQEKYKELFKVVNTGRLHMSEIEKRVKSFSPDVVVYDQYQKAFVKTSGDTNTADHRTEISQSLKDLSKKYHHHFLCATQASADSGQFLTEMNIDGSKTGVAGEFRTIIGIGKDREDTLKPHYDKEGNIHMCYKRYFNVCKNKGRMGASVYHLEPELGGWYE